MVTAELTMFIVFSLSHPMTWPIAEIVFLTTITIAEPTRFAWNKTMPDSLLDFGFLM